MFHKENELKNYFDKLIEKCIENADLHGVLLTGLSYKSINLFQAYIDKTGDFQSVALIIIHSTFQDVLDDTQVKNWIDRFVDNFSKFIIKINLVDTLSYRELLNKWEFWDVRAIYDNLYQKLRKSNIHIQRDKTYKVFDLESTNAAKFQAINLTCNNCGKNILEKTKNRISSYYSANITNAPTRNDVIMGCFDCAKFLPQCSVCMQIMAINPAMLVNAHSSLILNKQSLNSSNSNANNNSHSSLKSLNVSHNDDNYTFLTNNKFGNQFSSCMSCKHGGHLKHLIEWFNLNSKCAVPHCTCNCLKIDDI